MTIHIVRHGQTEENQQHILQGHMPGTLTPQGREQVRLAAERLAAKGITYRAIVTSDLRRAMDSAEIIARKHMLPVVPMAELRERDWGIYTGMTVADAARQYKRHGQWRFPTGDAETDAEILLRAHRALTMLGERYDKDDNIIVVTHGQFARNLIAARLGASYHDVVPMVNAEIRELHI
ncbi:MAG: histidine phosphatase family protein [Prevotella sp.]